MDKHQDPNSPFKADEIELDKFVESALWQDFKVVLDRRRQAIMIDMRNPALSIEQLRYLQGEIAGVEFWAKLPVEVKAERDRIEEAKKKGDIK